MSVEKWSIPVNFLTYGFPLLWVAKSAEQQRKESGVERYYSDHELSQLGLGGFGRNVRLDRSTIIVNPAGLCIGDNTRIDAFCLISAAGPGVSIGSNVHIGAGTYIFGGGGVTIEDFAAVSVRCAIFSTNDDFSGEYMIGPAVPSRFRNVTAAPVRVARHAAIGAGSVVLPGVTFGEGSAAGALSLVTQNVNPFTMVLSGSARAVKPRSRRLLELEAEMLRCQQEQSA
ncbi:MAG TPA: hypothetical protein VGJ09_05095 [Bryobacteraceae bacterium]